MRSLRVWEFRSRRAPPCRFGFGKALGAIAVAGRRRCFWPFGGSVSGGGAAPCCALRFSAAGVARCFRGSLDFGLVLPAPIWALSCCGSVPRQPNLALAALMRSSASAWCLGELLARSGSQEVLGFLSGMV